MQIGEAFVYSAEDGCLRWQVRPLCHFKTVAAWKRFNSIFSGREVGSLRTHDVTGKTYRTCSWGGRTWWVHRLIWTLVHGPIPAGMQIDHINGCGSDNRLDNLRLVTPSDNQRNTRKRKNNTSGYSGVTFHKQRQRWAAQAICDGRHVHLGLFETAAEAAKARAAFNAKHSYHERHGEERPL